MRPISSLSRRATQRRAAHIGFTLIELMVVVAIIGVLASVAIPNYVNYMAKARFAGLIPQLAPYKMAISQCAIEDYSNDSTMSSGAWQSWVSLCSDNTFNKRLPPNLDYTATPGPIPYLKSLKAGWWGGFLLYIQLKADVNDGFGTRSYTVTVAQNADIRKGVPWTIDEPFSTCKTPPAIC